MSNKAVSILKIPENAKLTSVVEGEMVTEDGKTTLTATSVNWILAALMVAGFVLIPSESLFISAPVVLAVLLGVSAPVVGMFLALEKVPYSLMKELNNLSDLDVAKSQNSSLGKVKISYWSCSSAAVFAHFLLPVRIFKKVKLHEEVIYYPKEDTYTKETYYLTFRKVAIVEETFEGSRAVFNKALESF